MHIPDDPLYYEKFYFTPGDLGFQAFDDALRARSASLVCWDQWYPEARAADGAARRRDPLLPDRDRLASGRRRNGAAQHEAWEHDPALARDRQRRLRRAVNRVGHARASVEFWGASFVADPFGRVLAAGVARPRRRCSSSTATSTRIEDARRNWPFLRDRRIDAYDGLTRRSLARLAAGTPRRARLPLAGGVGAARGDLARRGRTTRTTGRAVRAECRGLRRDRARAGAGASACAILVPATRRMRRGGARGRSRRRAFRLRRRLLHDPDRRRLGPRPRPDLRRCATRGARAAARSTAVQRLGREVSAAASSTTRSPQQRREGRSASPRVGAGHRARGRLASTATARARCSPPRPAC